jgi:hypothetical protein
MREPNDMAMSTICTCSSQLVASTFSSVMIAVHQFSTWIAPSDVGLHVSLILVRKEKPMMLKKEPHQPHHYYHQLSPRLWLTA